MQTRESSLSVLGVFDKKFGGKWVAEIREPASHRGGNLNRLWFRTFCTAAEAALAYGRAASATCMDAMHS